MPGEAQSGLVTHTLSRASPLRPWPPLLSVAATRCGKVNRLPRLAPLGCAVFFTSRKRHVVLFMRMEMLA